MARTTKRHGIARRRKLERRKAKRKKASDDPGFRQGQRRWKTQPTTTRKLSAVLWDHAMPILDPIDELDLEGVHRGFSLAVTVWNAVLLEQQAGNEEGLALLSRHIDEHLEGTTRQLARDAADLLVRRKTELFAEDRRMVLEFEITGTEDAFHLAVASAS